MSCLTSQNGPELAQQQTARKRKNPEPPSPFEPKQQSVSELEQDRRGVEPERKTKLSCIARSQEDSKTCRICLKEVQDLVLWGKCRHQYCRACLLEYLRPTLKLFAVPLDRPAYLPEDFRYTWSTRKYPSCRAGTDTSLFCENVEPPAPWMLECLDLHETRIACSTADCTVSGGVYSNVEHSLHGCRARYLDCPLSSSEDQHDTNINDSLPEAPAAFACTGHIPLPCIDDIKNQFFGACGTVSTYALVSALNRNLDKHLRTECQFPVRCPRPECKDRPPMPICKVMAHEQEHRSFRKDVMTIVAIAMNSQIHLQQEAIRGAAELLRYSTSAAENTSALVERLVNAPLSDPLFDPDAQTFDELAEALADENEDGDS